MGYPTRGIVGVLNSFGHDQYPLKSDIDPLCLITEYAIEGINFLVGFGRATQYPSKCQKICYGVQCIYGMP